MHVLNNKPKTIYYMVYCTCQLQHHTLSLQQKWRFSFKHIPKFERKHNLQCMKNKQNTIQPVSNQSSNKRDSRLYSWCGTSGHSSLRHIHLSKFGSVVGRVEKESLIRCKCINVMAAVNKLCTALHNHNPWACLGCPWGKSSDQSCSLASDLFKL